MTQRLEIVDQEMLLKDQSLSQVLKMIKEKVMKGHLIEIKSIVQDSKSNKSSFISSRSESGQAIPATMPISWKYNQEQEPLNTYTNRETNNIVDQASFSNQILGPRDIVTTRPDVQDQLIDSESSQSLYSDDEPQNIEFISQRLDDVERQLPDTDVKQASSVIKQLYAQTILLIFRTQNQREFLQRYCYLAIKGVCLQAMALKKMGNFVEAIKQLENSFHQFDIHDPSLKGAILIEAGKLSVLIGQFNKAQDHYYKALLLYESLSWKLEIAKTLTKLARLNSLLSKKEFIFNLFLENYDIAKKLSYESIVLFKQFLSPFDEKIADSYLVLAETYYMCKEMDIAFEFVEQSINIKFAKYNTNKHQVFIKDYNLLGIIYAHYDDYKQSLLYFKEALSCCDKCSLQRGQILNNLGVIHSALGYFDKALKCFNIAESSYQSLITTNQHQLLTKLQLNKEISQEQEQELEQEEDYNHN